MKRQVSPLGLLQEIYWPDSWKILVCVMMLNQTTGTQVHQIIKKLFRKYPTPEKMAKANPGDIYKIIEMCGLGDRRSRALIRMSQDYLSGEWLEPKNIFGIGQYGQDSYDIFVREKKNVKPQDKELKKYVQWQRKVLREQKQKKNSK